MHDDRLLALIEDVVRRVLREELALLRVNKPRRGEYHDPDRKNSSAALDNPADLLVDDGELTERAAIRAVKLKRTRAPRDH